MDITDATPARLALGIERFFLGDPIQYHDVSFWVRGGKLVVSSFSDWTPERTTPDNAKMKIARSKAVFDELKNLSVQFRDFVESLPRQYEVVYDYHTGGILLAKESNGQFEWLNE